MKKIIFVIAVVFLLGGSLNARAQGVDLNTRILQHLVQQIQLVNELRAEIVYLKSRIAELEKTQDIKVTPETKATPQAQDTTKETKTINQCARTTYRCTIQATP